jgi:hypothetical protein
MKRILDAIEYTVYDHVSLFTQIRECSTIFS